MKRKSKGSKGKVREVSLSLGLKSSEMRDGRDRLGFVSDVHNSLDRKFKSTPATWKKRYLFEMGLDTFNKDTVTSVIEELSRLLL